MPLRILLLGILPLLLAVAATADPPERPNFVVVVFDDLGYADVGAYGSTFSVFGVRGSGSQVRVYLDGIPQIELEMDGLAISDQPLRLGRDLAGRYPFEGLLWSPSFRRIALLPHELADRDADGVPDASDLCVGVHDPPESEGVGQWDVDGDGLGDACDADFDGNGRVTAPDWLRLIAAYGSVVGDPLYDPVVDLDRNGSVNRVDVLSLMIAFGEPPVPSGVACGGTALCYRP